jgi:hypothetical protein
MPAGAYPLSNSARRGELVRALPLVPAAQVPAAVESLSARAGEDLVAVSVRADPPVEAPVPVLGPAAPAGVGGEPLLPDVGERGTRPVGVRVARCAPVNTLLPGVPLLLGERDAVRRQLNDLADHAVAVLTAVVGVDLGALEVLASSAIPQHLTA